LFAEQQPAPHDFHPVFASYFDFASEDYHLQSNSLFFPPDLRTSSFQPTADSCNISLPTTQDLPYSTAGLIPAAVYPDIPPPPPPPPPGHIIYPAVDQRVLPIADGAESPEDAAIVSLSLNAPSSSSLIQSTTIRCSWPTCEKEFKNRSDYKYVPTPPTFLAPLMGTNLALQIQSSLQIPQPAISMLVLSSSASHQTRA